MTNDAPCENDGREEAENLFPDEPEEEFVETLDHDEHWWKHTKQPLDTWHVCDDFIDPLAKELQEWGFGRWATHEMAGIRFLAEFDRTERDVECDDTVSSWKLANKRCHP